MFVGFDYGTSNCAVSWVDQGKAALIPLYADNAFVPSTLYAVERSFIADYVAQHLTDAAERVTYGQSRAALLSKARADKIEHELESASEGLFFGAEAIAHYIDAPSEGYFIKSPKSFLGASGLRQQSIDFFEDLVAAMMLNVKARAEQHLGRDITQAVIGRPVNFQGINAEESNRQAQEILLAAATRVGFRNVEFLFEPLAAGFDFETRLRENKRVLVVDVGGGTTDCSMVLMGPAHIKQFSRAQDFLGHTGERIGGNDFDIQCAQQLFMPEFGMLSPLKSGLPMPLMPFVNGVAVNDLGAQTEFYDLKTQLLLERLSRDTTEPALLKRFSAMRTAKKNFAVVRLAEDTKIALSSAASVAADLGFIETDFSIHCSAERFAVASDMLLQKITTLIADAMNQAGTTPDLVYLTGGSAKSPLIQQAIRRLLGEEIPLVDGDHFGSVATGLGVWAQRVFA